MVIVCVRARTCMHVYTHMKDTEGPLFLSALLPEDFEAHGFVSAGWPVNSQHSPASLPQYQTYRQTRPCAVGFFSFFESAKGTGDSNSGFQAFTSKHFNPLSQLMVIFSRHFPVRQSYCLTLLSIRTQMETNWLLEELNEIVLVQGMVYSEHNIF